jgi:hypothetical protein
MMRFSTRRLAVCVLLAVLVFTLSGCWNPFAPDSGKPKPIEPADYHERLAPEDVIHNLTTAYVWKNAGEYLDCLSEDFIFYPTADDVANPNNPLPPEWYKDTETLTHQAMFAQGSNVESISLTLTETSRDYQEGIPEDPTDDIYVINMDVDLRVNVIPDITLLATAPSQFWFRVDQDQQGEGGELWYEIYLWYDDPVRGASRTEQNPDVEYMSLGQIKSLFWE